MLATALALLLTAATPLPGAAPAARIVSQQARWTGLAPVDDLGTDTEGMFLISGEVRNDGSLPVAAVGLVYELVADGVVVASEHGYNRRAEALRDPEVESGAVRREQLAIAPLQPGESDMFRMMFLRGAVPRFDTWRVRIDETLPATATAPPRP